MPVVTIGRMFGSGGETIAAMVAQRLGADLLDRKIFDEVARRLDMPEDEVEKLEEVPGSLLNRILQALGSASIEFAAPPEGSVWTPPYAEPTVDTTKAVLQITQEVIREAHRSGNAVIVGRGAAYVLRGEPDVLHVFAMGPREGSDPGRGVEPCRDSRPATPNTTSKTMAPPTAIGQWPRR